MSYQNFSQQEICTVDVYTNRHATYQPTLVWIDGNPMTDANVDGVMFIKVNGLYYQRNVDETINVKWFGAKGDGITDDTLAFENMLGLLSNSKYNYKVFIPEDEYIINKGLIVKGVNNLPIIQGAGMRNTILNFSGNVDNFCLQIGETDSNSLNGGLIDFQIKGNGLSDGLIIKGTSPYTVAWCRFENLYFYNLNNGIVDDVNVIFLSSHFSNIHIEKYFGKGMIIYGGYNTYSGIFITQPSGQTSKDNPDPQYGAANLTMEVHGGSNTFSSVQCEDQIYIIGAFNTFINLTIEHIIKGQVNAELQGNAIFVGGASTLFNNLRIIGLKNSLFQYLMTIHSQNVTIINARYEDQDDASQKIAYPYFPYPSSSGLMMNCFGNTLYKLDNPNNAFLDGTKSWSFINVEGTNYVFSRIKNEGYKLTSQQRDQLTPDLGLEIYNTDNNSKEFWNGTQWKTILTN